MNNTYNNIIDLKDKFDVFIFDAYGVFWNGSDFYSGSREAMQYLVKNNKYVCVLSNTTQVSLKAEDSYAKKGLIKGIHYNKIITSGEVTRDALLKGKVVFSKNPNARKVYQFGTPNAQIFDGTDYVNVENISDAELIYISVPQVNESEYNKLKDQYKDFLFETEPKKGSQERLWNSTKGDVFFEKIKELLSSGLPILNANPDYTASEGIKNGGIKIFAIRQGYITQVLRMAKAEVIEFGKPYKEIYDFTFNSLKEDGVDISNRDRICMVGDTLRTDIRGANNANIKSVLCLETGVISNQISSGKRLEDLMKKDNVVVDYIIKSVGFGYVKKENIYTHSKDINISRNINNSIIIDNNKNNNSVNVENKFELVPGLAKKEHIIDLKLSTVLFENNRFYPWVFLVPMKNGVKNMTYLTMDERIQLMKEMAIVEKVMSTLFEHTQINVAMIGNKTPQLHVHILCRKEGDPDWPGTVWGNSSEPYTDREKHEMVDKIKTAIEKELTKLEYKY